MPAGTPNPAEVGQMVNQILPEQREPLLRTKLFVPPARAKRVSRGSLTGQINANLDKALILVSAPAGFGKTTLLAGWAAQAGLPVAWVSLDAGDNDLHRFLRYVVAALRSTLSGQEAAVCETSQALLQSVPPPPTQAVLIPFINDLSDIPQEFVLVLDDYHFITSPAVHEALAFILEHLPPHAHLVISSRSDPSLPLHRLRGRQQMVELRTDDLRFTAAEAGEFLNAVMQLSLSEEQVVTLEARTEGWIVGLQMAALSMQGPADHSSFIQAFSGSHRYILEYLIEEVLNRQPEDIQAFLLQTSILERLCGPLCDALTGAEGKSRQVLESLEHANIFLVALDGVGTWYRYHHLFADLLRVRLQQAHPDSVPGLHMRASAWFEQKRFYVEAIQHLFAAREDGRAADLIERYGSACWSENDLSVVQMADSLPPDILAARPKIGLYQAWLNIIQGHVEKSLPQLNDMARLFSGAGPDPGQRWMQTVTGLALAFLSRPVTIPGFDPLPDARMLDEIPADELILRSTADLLYGMTLARKEGIDRAVAFTEKALQSEKTQHGRLANPPLTSFLTRIYLMQGRLHEAASLCREYLDPLQEKGVRFIYAAGSMHIDLGEVLYEWNCLEEAEKHIQEGLQDNEPWGNLMTESFGLTALARVLQAKGDHAGAMQVVERLEAGQNSRPVEFAEEIRTLRIRLQLASGDLQGASLRADQVLLSEDFHHNEKYYRFTLARVRLAQKRYAAVEELLTGSDPRGTAGSRIARQIESDLLLAAAAAGQERLQEAFGFIESGLAAAEPEGYIHVFLDAGEPIRELLAAFLRSDAPGHRLFAQKVLEAFSPIKGAGSPVPRPAGLVELLSGRELEVLHLMAQGRTNHEIARQLIVAPGTVKAHTASIYRKLDVANRTEAVARARQLGYLP